MSEIEDKAVRPDTQLTHFLYLAHAVAPFTFWLLAIGAVIVGMVTRDKVRGTLLDSHYSWLQRTFFWGLLWIAVSCVITVILIFTIVGILIWWLPWTIVYIWYLYRVIRGWLLLNDGKPAP